MPAVDTIKLRRGTAAAWTSANPVLASGEPGYETDTGSIKVGDGTTAWAALPYRVQPGAYATPLVSPPGAGTSGVIPDLMAAAPTGVAATDTANLNSAITAAITNKARLTLQPGTYSVNATLNTVDLTKMSLVGPGSAICTIAPTSAVTGDVLRVTPAAFTTAKAGELRGFTVDGTTAGAGAVGVHYGDLIGGGMDDLDVVNFSGAGSVGIKFDNVTNWTERTVLGRVYVANNTTGILFAVNGGTTSFARTKFLAVSIQTSAASQIGVHLTGNAAVYGCALNMSGNLTGASAIAVKLDAGTKIQGHCVWDFEEQTASALLLSNAGTLVYTGYINDTGGGTNSVNTGTLTGTPGSWLKVPGVGFSGPNPSLIVQNGLGTSPPSPVLEANSGDYRGAFTLGTGTAPTAGGALVDVALSDSFNVAPSAVIVVPTTAAAAALQPFVLPSDIAAQSFFIRCVGTPAASQPNTTYGFAYYVIP